MSTIKIRGEIAEVSLTNHDQPAIIDVNMVDRVKQCRSWHVSFSKNGEVKQIGGRVPAVGMVILARWLMREELEETEIKNADVDHVNRQPLNNLKANLRIVTRSTNLRSRRVMGKTSRFPGVVWHKQHKKWQAGIRIDGKRKHIGLFTSELDAARAYRAKYKMLDPISEYECWLELDKPQESKQTTLNQFFAEKTVVNQGK